MAEKKKQLPGLITGLVAILAVVAFIILGFTTHQWYIVWLVFLAIPLAAIAADMATTDKKKSDMLIGMTAILAVVAFVLLGFLAGLWHIAWIVFLLIPAMAIIVKIVETAKAEAGGKAEADGEADKAEK